MGGLLGGGTPKIEAPKPVAKPVTAVAKTPSLELDDTELETEAEALGKKKKGKKALRTDIKDPATQTGAEGTGAMAGVQVQK